MVVGSRPSSPVWCFSVKVRSDASGFVGLSDEKLLQTGLMGSVLWKIHLEAHVHAPNDQEGLINGTPAVQGRRRRLWLRPLRRPRSHSMARFGSNNKKAKSGSGKTGFFFITWMISSVSK